jgi:ornithine cyclodeaminase
VIGPAHYDAATIGRLLTMPACIAAVRQAMADLSDSGIVQPLREIVEVVPGHLFGIMPGLLGTREHYGAKLVSVAEDPARPGRAAHRGSVVLFARASGEVVCTGDAGAITTIRTAAASAVATDALARADADQLGLFGCGAIAGAHIRAIAAVRPLREVLVWGRDAERARRFAATQADLTGLPVRAVEDPRIAARAPIICTVTASPKPILFGDWVIPGTHVNVVGSSYRGPVEVDAALVQASRYIADSRRSALAAASELLDACEAGLITPDHIAAEIGEVLLGQVPGRRAAEEITLYKSLGHIVQDLAALATVHQLNT